MQPSDGNNVNLIYEPDSSRETDPAQLSRPAVLYADEIKKGRRAESAANF
jgi:hypothetical protein